jgi:hypothetical protein
VILNQAELDRLFMGAKEPVAKRHSSQHRKHKYQRLQVASTKSNDGWAWAKSSNPPACPKYQTANDERFADVSSLGDMQGVTKKGFCSFADDIKAAETHNHCTRHDKY